MNGNPIPPGYHPDDELWTQHTEVFAAIGDDYEPEPARPKMSQASKYAIIGLSATIVVSVLAIGGILLSRGSGWNAAPNAATGPNTPHVVLTPPPSTSPTVTTTPSAIYSGTDAIPSSTSATTTTTTPTTTTTAAAAAHTACTQPGVSTVADDGTVLTCDVTTYSWLPVSRPAIGYPCNASEAGTFGYASNGTQLVCARRAGTTTQTYAWDSPGTLTTGKHDPGQPCNLKKDVIAQSSSGRAVYCQPQAGTSNPYLGAWKLPS
ncbi:hypothetical protein [Nocardia sp. NPDC004722]